MACTSAQRPKPAPDLGRLRSRDFNRVGSPAALRWLVPPLSDRSRRRTWAGFGHAILPAWFATLPRSTTTAAAAAAAAATRTAAEGASAVGLGPGLVNIEGAPIQLGAVQGGDSAIGLGAVRHLDKREGTRAARIAVGNQVDPLHVPVRLKERTDGRLGCGKIQIAYKNVFHLKGSFVFDGSGKRRGRWTPAKAVAGRSKTNPVYQISPARAVAACETVPLAQRPHLPYHPIVNRKRPERKTQRGRWS